MSRHRKDIDDRLATWYDEDKTKLEALEAEWERDGGIALERIVEKDPVFFVQIAALFFPREVRKTLEDMLIDEGLTDADVRAMFERMLRDRKH